MNKTSLVYGKCAKYVVGMCTIQMLSVWCTLVSVLTCGCW